MPWVFIACRFHALWSLIQKSLRKSVLWQLCGVESLTLTFPNIFRNSSYNIIFRLMLHEGVAVRFCDISELQGSQPSLFFTASMLQCRKKLHRYMYRPSAYFPNLIFLFCGNYSCMSYFCSSPACTTLDKQYHKVSVVRLPILPPIFSDKPNPTVQLTDCKALQQNSCSSYSQPPLLKNCPTPRSILLRILGGTLMLIFCITHSSASLNKTCFFHLATLTFFFEKHLCSIFWPFQCLQSSYNSTHCESEMHSVVCNIQ